MGRCLLAVLAGAACLSACNQALEIGRATGPETPGGDGATDGGPPVAPDAAGDTAPTILWFADFESGDTTAWSAGGPAAGGGDQHGATVSVPQEQAHGGTHAYRISFDTTDHVDHGAELFRRVVDGPAYYSAWYFIDGAHAPATYWTLFAFFYETEAGDTAGRHSLWDVNLNSQIAYFYDESTKRFVDASPRQAYPVGRWFHLEARFTYDPPRSAHITVWQDGVQILDLANLGTAPSDNLYWAVVSDSDALTPPACTIYVDDAAISTGRLGP